MSEKASSPLTQFKKHITEKQAQDMCENRGGLPYGLCGRKATLNLN